MPHFREVRQQLSVAYIGANLEVVILVGDNGRYPQLKNTSRLH